MFLTPFLNDIGATIASGIERRSGKILLPSPDEAEGTDYILVCGFGRVGQVHPTTANRGFWDLADAAEDSL